MGKVVRIVPFGAFIELMPGRDGLLHISQISKDRIERVEDVLQMGDEIEVRVIEIDPQGKVRLSRKEAVRPIEAAPPRGDRDGAAVAAAAVAGRRLPPLVLAALKLRIAPAPELVIPLRRLCYGVAMRSSHEATSGPRAKKTVLPNGVRVLTETLDHVDSVSLGAVAELRPGG